MSYKQVNRDYFKETQVIKTSRNTFLGFDIDDQASG